MYKMKTFYSYVHVLKHNQKCTFGVTGFKAERGYMNTKNSLLAHSEVRFNPALSQTSTLEQIKKYMMFLTIFLGLFVIFLGVLVWHRTKNKGEKRLPGPTPLPLLGNLLQIGFRPHVTFTKWAKRYGPIYRIKLGLENVILVNDHKLIKELFNDPASTGRLNDNAVPQEFSKGSHGIMMATGKRWEAQRKFTVRTLRNFGFNRSSIESVIMNEVETLLDWFRKREGSPISGDRLFNAPVVNSVWRMVTGERCKWEESKPAICEAMDNFFKELMNLTTNGLYFAPVLRFVAPNMLRWNHYVKSVDTMMDLLKGSIQKHRETFNSADLRDYIDHYLLEIENETDPNSSFYKDCGNANMIAGVFDLFFAGSETSSTTLSWTLLYLSEHQEILTKLQQEIDNVVGMRLPSLQDKINMPYSEAVISEVLRISAIVTCGIPHKMESDVIFHGYFLPKRTSVFANLYAVHHDPNVWGDPENFRPERFLNEDGTKFVQNEALIPFSEGKRKCIGDSFGKDTLFLFVTCICQQFDILPDPDNKTAADFEPEFGLLLAPKPFKVLVSSRKRGVN